MTVLRQILYIDINRGKFGWEQRQSTSADNSETSYQPKQMSLAVAIVLTLPFQTTIKQRRYGRLFISADRSPFGAICPVLPVLQLQASISV